MLFGPLLATQSTKNLTSKGIFRKKWDLFEKSHIFIFFIQGVLLVLKEIFYIDAIDSCKYIVIT